MSSVETESHRDRHRTSGRASRARRTGASSQGQGVFFDDIKRHGMGYLHFVRSPYAHARIDSIDVCAALELPGVFGTLTGDEVAILTDPFFQIAPPPGGHIKDYALAVGKVRYVGEPVAAVVAETRELARDAAELDRGRVRAARRGRRRAHARATRARPCCTRSAAATCPGRGVCEWGDVDAAFAEADHVVRDRRAALRPLQLDAARVRRRARRVQPRHRAVDDLTQQPVPGLRRDHDGPGDAASGSTSSASSRRTSAAASATRSPRTRSSSPAACSRASSSARSSGRSGGPTSTSRCRTATSAGSRTSRSRSRPTATLLGFRTQGARRRRRLPALRAARRRDLGAGRARACTAGATSASSSRRS